MKIAVTLPVFEDFVRSAAGDHAEVFSVVPPGVDPRNYEPTDEDIERFAGVEFFYANGLGLDDQIFEVFQEYMDEGAHVIPFGPNVRSPTSHGYADDAGDEAHLYLDPDLAAIYVAIVADEFVIYDEVNREYYDDRFRNEVEALELFAAELAADIEAIPEARRHIVARSEAVTHIARRFGLAVAELATQAPGESRSDTVRRLVEAVQANKVPGVFGEYGHDNSLLEQVAGEAGVEMCTLYTDITDAGAPSYEAMMRANADELARCLGE